MADVGLHGESSDRRLLAGSVEHDLVAHALAIACDRRQEQLQRTVLGVVEHMDALDRKSVV